MPDAYLCPAHTPDLDRRELHYNNSVEGKMPEKHVDIRFSHNVSLTGLADELTAIKTAIMLISTKLPLSANPHHKDNQM